MAEVAKSGGGMQELIKQMTIEKEPLKNYFYMNHGPMFLALLAEKIHGKTTRQLFADLIAELKLTETICSDQATDSPPTEIRDGEEWVNKAHDVSTYYFGGITGYAGLFSSALDLAKFGRAWLERKIVSDKVTREAFTSYGHEGEERHGLGWYNRVEYFPLFPPHIFCQSGYVGTLLAVNPRDNIVYALNTNRVMYGHDNQKYRALWVYLLEREIREVLTVDAFVRQIGDNAEKWWMNAQSRHARVGHG
jgi:CubicO group peptidase (beta-lactamase class C family)